MNYYVKKIGGLRSQWNSVQKNNRHPWQLKKLKSWGPFRSYQLPIYPIYHENRPNGLNWQCCLAGSSKTAPRILISSIALGADYSFELNSIETYAPQFFGHNNLFLGSVTYEWSCSRTFKKYRLNWVR